MSESQQDRAFAELNVARLRVSEYVSSNFNVDPIAEAENRDAWTGLEARLDLLVVAARNVGPMPMISSLFAIEAKEDV